MQKLVQNVTLLCLGNQSRRTRRRLERKKLTAPCSPDGNEARGGKSLRMNHFVIGAIVISYSTCYAIVVVRI